MTTETKKTDAVDVDRPFQNRHDDLTGLRNRRGIVDEIRRAQRHASESDTHVGVLYIDLDRFTDVRASVGAREGDRVLREVAERVRSVLRSADVGARLDDDEFVVLCHDLDDDETIAWSQLRAAAARVHHSIDQPITLDDGEVAVSASIGLNVISGLGDDAPTLLDDADRAMNEAKALGRARRLRNGDTTRRQAFGRLQMASELQHAIERRDVGVVFQPIVDLTTGAVYGFDTLVRWHHPVFGEVPAAEFIEIAEDSASIVSLGELVIDRACRFLASQHRDAATRVSVNISVDHFERSDLAGNVRRQLHRWGLGSERLMLAVAETALADADTGSIQQLEGLRKLGVGIGVDDFGTGPASLTSLTSLPVSFVKLAPHVTRGLGVDPDDHTFCDAVLALGRALDLDVIAEGVESGGQADVLTQLGCRFAQGYLFGRPHNATDS